MRTFTFYRKIIISIINRIAITCPFTTLKVLSSFLTELEGFNYRIIKVMADPGQMTMDNQWRNPQYRQKVVAQIDEALRQSGKCQKVKRENIYY